METLFVFFEGTIVILATYRNLQMLLEIGLLKRKKYKNKSTKQQQQQQQQQKSESY